MADRVKSALKLSIKLAITIGLFWFIATQVDIGAALQAVQGVPKIVFIAALLMIACQLVIMALRWSYLISLTGDGLKLGFLTRLVFEGMFFNQALPSSVGGDAVRIYRLAGSGVRASRAIGSVLLDRAFGLLGLSLIAAAFAPGFIGLVTDPALRSGGLLIIAMALGLFLVFLALDLLPAMLRRWRVVDELLNLSRLARRVMLTPGSILRVGLATIASQMIALSALYIMAVGLGIDIAYGSLMAILPVVILITTIPITIAGWGLREGAMVLGLAQAGVPEAPALALSVMFGLVQIAAGLPGGLLWLAARRGKPAPDLAKDTAR